MNKNATLEKIVFLGVMLLLAFLSSGFGFRADSGEAQEPAVGKQTAEVQASASSFPTPPEASSSLPDASVGGSYVFHRVHGTVAPEVSVSEGLLADLKTGEIYFAKDIDHRWPMASISKLATAAFAANHLDPSLRVTLAPQNFTTQGGDLNTELKAGETFSVQDLLRAMLTFSSNEAAEALASAYGRDKFLAGMNAMVQDWGLENTHFSDPTGLSAANQSTPLDLLRLAQRIYDEYPQLYAVTRNKQAVLTELNSGRQEVVSNINLFAGREDFLGGKTGYTDEADGNLLSVFSYVNRPVVVIILGTNDRFGETDKLMDWFRQNYSTQ